MSRAAREGNEFCAEIEMGLCEMEGGGEVLGNEADAEGGEGGAGRHCAVGIWKDGWREKSCYVPRSFLLLVNVLTGWPREEFIST